MDDKNKVGAPVQTQLPVNEKPVDETTPKPQVEDPLKIAQKEAQHARDIAREALDKLQKSEDEKKFMVKANEVETKYLNPTVWAQMKGMAEVFARSGAFPVDMNASKLVVILEAGLEMGMKPIEAVKSFYFVKGTLNIFGAAITRRLREHGWRIEYQEVENKCTAIVKKNEEVYSDTMTFEDAEKSGWTKGSGGVKPGWFPGINRKLKLRYGALSMIIKTYLPEVLGSATDIAEVAMDMAPVISGEVMPAKTVDMKGGNDPADPAILKTIQTLKEKVEDTDPLPENLSKNEAATMVKDLTIKVAQLKKKPVKKEEEK